VPGCLDMFPDNCEIRDVQIQINELYWKTTSAMGGGPMILGRLPYKSDLMRELNKLAANQKIQSGVVQVMGSLGRV
jgi:hypothetical protein